MPTLIYRAWKLGRGLWDAVHIDTVSTWTGHEPLHTFCRSTADTERRVTYHFHGFPESFRSKILSVPFNCLFQHARSIITHAEGSRKYYPAMVAAAVPALFSSYKETKHIFDITWSCSTIHLWSGMKYIKSHKWKLLLLRSVSHTGSAAGHPVLWPAHLWLPNRKKINRGGLKDIKRCPGAACF